MHKKECCNENGKCRCNVWKCICWGVVGVIGFAAIAALLGFVIMYLWNWLIPGIFNLPTITYFQALGLAILSRLLFGGCGRGFRHMRDRYHKHGHGHGCGCHGESEKECCSDKSNEDECCKKDEAPKE